MAPVNALDICCVGLSTARTPETAVNTLQRIFGNIPLEDVFAVCRLEIVDGFEDADTVAIFRKAPKSHIFNITENTAMSLPEIAKLLNTPIEDLLLVQYQTNDGVQTPNTVAILETSPSGERSLRIIDLYSRTGNTELDKNANTLFRNHTSRDQYLSETLIACHHRIIINEQGMLDNFEPHTEGADSSRRFEGNVSLWGQTTPKLATSAESQRIVYEFIARFAQPDTELTE